jgi:hypothetical protein
MRSTSLRLALVAGLLLVPFSSDAMPTPSKTSTSNPTTSKPTTSKKTRPAETTTTDDDRRVPPRAPKPLPLAKRLARVNTIIAKLGHEKLTKLDDVQPLTPRTPELENGAKLLHAGGVGYDGPSQEAPDALFWLYYKGNIERSVVGFAWPTEVGKLYAMDCAVKVDDYASPSPPNAHDKAQIKIDGLDHALQPISGGHVVHAFIAVEASTYVRMEYRTDVDLSSRRLAWYGCEIVRAG